MNSFSQFFEPLFYIIDPSKRLFFIYLLSSFLIGAIVLLIQGQSLKQIIPSLFHVRLWNHQSSKLDVQLMFLNSMVRATLFILVALSSVVVANFVANQLYVVFPEHQPLDLSYSTWVVVYSVLSFIVLDFSRFFQHYLFHKIPFLWRFHKIHHSALVLTPMTLYRTHPVESLVSSFRRILVIGLMSGLFIFFSRSLLGAYAILGVNALDFVFNILGSNLRHSHVWLSFGPLNHLFISPAQHQIHHSRAEKHFDKNLGFALSLWDKIFGTFYQVRSKEFLIFGVRGERHLNLKQALKAPFRSKSQIPPQPPAQSPQWTSKAGRRVESSS